MSSNTNGNGTIGLTAPGFCVKTTATQKHLSVLAPKLLLKKQRRLGDQTPAAFIKLIPRITELSNRRLNRHEALKAISLHQEIQRRQNTAAKKSSLLVDKPAGANSGEVCSSGAAAERTSKQQKSSHGQAHPRAKIKETLHKQQEKKMQLLLHKSYNVSRGDLAAAALTSPIGCTSATKSLQWHTITPMIELVNSNKVEAPARGQNQTGHSDQAPASIHPLKSSRISFEKAQLARRQQPHQFLFCQPQTTLLAGMSDILRTTISQGSLQHASLHRLAEQSQVRFAQHPPVHEPSLRFGRSTTLAAASNTAYIKQRILAQQSFPTSALSRLDQHQPDSCCTSARDKKVTKSASGALAQQSLPSSPVECQQNQSHRFWANPEDQVVYSNDQKKSINRNFKKPLRKSNNDRKPLNRQRHTAPTTSYSLNRMPTVIVPNVPLALLNGEAQPRSSQVNALQSAKHETLPLRQLSDQAVESAGAQIDKPILSQEAAGKQKNLAFVRKISLVYYQPPISSSIRKSNSAHQSPTKLLTERSRKILSFNRKSKSINNTTSEMSRFESKLLAIANGVEDLSPLKQNYQPQSARSPNQRRLTQMVSTQQRRLFAPLTERDSEVILEGKTRQKFELQPERYAALLQEEKDELCEPDSESDHSGAITRANGVEQPLPRTSPSNIGSQERFPSELALNEKSIWAACAIKDAPANLGLPDSVNATQCKVSNKAYSGGALVKRVQKKILNTGIATSTDLVIPSEKVVSPTPRAGFTPHKNQRLLPSWGTKRKVTSNQDLIC